MAVDSVPLFSSIEFRENRVLSSSFSTFPVIFIIESSFIFVLSSLRCFLAAKALVMFKKKVVKYIELPSIQTMKPVMPFLDTIKNLIFPV